MLACPKTLVAAFLALALAPACHIPGHVRAVKTADRLEDLSASIEDLRGRVAATSTALSALIAQKDQDSESAFHQLADAVHALESGQRQVRARLEGVQHEAEAYFLTWKEQAATINDEDLKEHSEERRAELAKALDEVAEAMKPVHEALDTYLGTFRDTVKYLSIDLTPSSIASIEGRAKDASKSSKSIASKLTDALESVHEAAPLFAQARASSPKRSVEPDTGSLSN